MKFCVAYVSSFAILQAEKKWTGRITSWSYDVKVKDNLRPISHRNPVVDPLPLPLTRMEILGMCVLGQKMINMTLDIES